MCNPCLAYGAEWNRDFRSQIILGELGVIGKFQKYYTLDEARSLLPKLREIFREAHQSRDKFKEVDEELGRMLQSTNADLGGEPVTDMLTELLQMNVQMQRLQDMGIQIKDFDRGLVDFPHIHDGREVFLCWELEEEDIEFWHDIDTGYSDRQRL